MRAIVWLKRDLRVEDNRVFEEAKNYKEIIPVFIFDDQILADLMSYDKRLVYIINAIENIGIKVYTFKGKTLEIFKRLLDELKPDAVITQKAYSWDGEERVKQVKNLCSLYNVKFIEVFDGLLVNPELIPPKKVFTSFYKDWLKYLDLERTDVKVKNIPIIDLKTFDPKELISQLKIDTVYFKPQDCKKRLKSFDFKNYEKTRDYPYLDGTSKLSPCIRFGIISIREIFERSKESESFLRELAWREFWYHIKLNFPWTKDLEFQEKRRNIQWENNQKFIDAFLNASTGYPIIDAGIRQLIQEKWIHNRVRMILGSFLTKDLLVDWRIGEEFFKHHLIDYDQLVNIGNWQWIASVGADPNPLRIFNPILQAKRFDPNCEYIKKYIPELKNLPCHQLHDPLTYNLPYHKPIVNHYERVSIVKLKYK